MKYEFDNNVPIYLQIIEEIKNRIVAGTLAPGQQLDSVRAMAAEFEVNPNTIQRALSELEQRHLVYSQRTRGRFVTEDTRMIKILRHKMAVSEIRNAVERLRLLGFDSEEIESIFRESIEDEFSGDDAISVK